MAVTILQAQDAAHTAMVDVQGWVREFLEEWLRPLMEMQMARTAEQVLAMFEQMPDEMKAMMEKQEPVKYAAILKAVDDLKKRGKNGTN